MTSQQLPICLSDYEALSLKQVDPANSAYLFSSAADELTTKWYREAFNKFALVPRDLKNVTCGHTHLELLGETLSYPEHDHIYPF